MPALPAADKLQPWAAIALSWNCAITARSVRNTYEERVNRWLMAVRDSGNRWRDGRASHISGGQSWDGAGAPGRPPKAKTGAGSTGPGAA